MGRTAGFAIAGMTRILANLLVAFSIATLLNRKVQIDAFSEQRLSAQILFD